MSTESDAVAAFRELFNGPVPTSPIEYRRAIMLAVLIGREIECEMSEPSALPRHGVRTTDVAL